MLAETGIIAVVTCGNDDLSGVHEAPDCGDLNLSLINVDSLSRGGLDGLAVDAVLYPITEATDSLHEEVTRLRADSNALPVISYAADAAAPADALRERSRKLGCAAHLDGPLSGPEVVKTVRRECRLAEALDALSRSREEARREHEKVTHLVDIIKTVNSVLEPARVIDVVMEKARATLRSEIWCLFLMDDGDDALTLSHVGGVRVEDTRPYRLRAGKGIVGHVLESQRPVIVNDVQTDERHDPEFDRRVGIVSRSVLVAPLISRGQVVGVVKLVNRVPGGFFSPADQSLVTLLMEPAAIALENAILFKKME
ncbi:MAG: GAF domain-containing protein [Acidobacteriota bacterium]